MYINPLYLRKTSSDLRHVQLIVHYFSADLNLIRSGFTQTKTPGMLVSISLFQSNAAPLTVTAGL